MKSACHDAIAISDSALNTLILTAQKSKAAGVLPAAFMQIGGF